MDSNKMLELIAIQIQLLDWNRAQPKPPILIGHEYGVATEALRIIGCAPQNEDPQNVARTEWDGEGLPPIGATCEVDVAGVWISGVVLAHCLPPKEGFAVAQIDDEIGIAIGVAHDFRTLRTPEQIAADERESGIQALKQVFDSCSDKLEPTSNKYLDTLFGAIYDAGWRKP